jgi:hypothetical protein
MDKLSYTVRQVDKAMLLSEESIKKAFGDNEYVLSKNKNGKADDDISDGEEEEDDLSDEEIDKFNDDNNDEDNDDNNDEDNEDFSHSFLGHIINFWNLRKKHLITDFAIAGWMFSYRSIRVFQKTHPRMQAVMTACVWSK